MIKPEVRILGFDDGAFESKSKGKVPIVGVVFRGGKFLDGALKTEVSIDGNDATEKIAKLINSSKHKQQLKVIMFDGVTLGGFNIVDIKKLYKKTGLPVIVINRKVPNLKEVENALRNFKDFETRWKKILNAGKIKECNIKENKKVYYQSIGLEEEEVEEIIKLSTTRSFIPEPLRVAHIIATAIVKGESSGRA
ncbi:MAG: DUF99 family protein [Candidatus Aenigmatarchaeota archaeon]